MQPVKKDNEASYGKRSSLQYGLSSIFDKVRRAVSLSSLDGSSPVGVSVSGVGIMPALVVLLLVDMKPSRWKFDPIFSRTICRRGSSNPAALISTGNIRENCSTHSTADFRTVALEWMRHVRSKGMILLSFAKAYWHSLGPFEMLPIA